MTPEQALAYVKAARALARTTTSIVCRTGLAWSGNHTRTTRQAYDHAREMHMFASDNLRHAWECDAKANKRTCPTQFGRMPATEP